MISQIKMSELSSNQGVLFFKKVNGELGYHENGDEDRDRKYVGEIENGLPNGQGTYTNLDGYKYVGEFKNGGRHGKGTYTWKISFNPKYSSERITSTGSIHLLR